MEKEFLTIRFGDNMLQETEIFKQYNGILQVHQTKEPIIDGMEKLTVGMVGKLLILQDIVTQCILQKIIIIKVFRLLTVFLI